MWHTDLVERGARELRGAARRGGHGGAVDLVRVRVRVRVGLGARVRVGARIRVRVRVGF